MTRLTEQQLEDLDSLLTLALGDETLSKREVRPGPRMRRVPGRAHLRRALAVVRHDRLQAHGHDFI